MKSLLITLSIIIICFPIYANEVLKTKESKYGFNETQTKLEESIKQKGLILFAKINHADGAKKIGLKMLPSIVTIFGNPKGGTPFMEASPEAAIDFPLKALVWENASGKVFLSYYPMSSIVARHNIKGQEELTKKLDEMLVGIATDSTK